MHWKHRTVVASLVLGILAAWSTAAHAQSAAPLFCTDRSALAVAMQAEDRTAAESALAGLTANAPPEIADPVATLSGLIVDHGNHAFVTKKGDKALGAIDEHVAATCGFPVLPVTGLDYLYEGITSPMVAGTYVIQLTNSAPAEHHELVLAAVDPSVDLPIKKLLKASESRLSQVAALFAKPGKTDSLVVVLEPGRYVYACFIDVNTTSGGASDHADHGSGDGAAEPHWGKGMRGELEVVGGA